MKTICYNNLVPQQIYRCGQCGRRFTTGKALGCHLKSHTKLAPAFKCVLCYTTFTNQSNLSRHQKRAHPVQIDGVAVVNPEPTSTARLEVLARTMVRSALNHACKVCAVVLVNLLRFFYICFGFFRCNHGSLMVWTLAWYYRSIKNEFWLSCSPRRNGIWSCGLKWCAGA